MNLVVLLNHYPALSETFVAEEIAALRRLGHRVRVEAGAWADPAAPLGDDPPPLTVLADDGIGRRLVDLAWLAARRPGAVLADLRDRWRWGREEAVHPLRVLAPVARRLHQGGERHVHVYFADVAALDALRLTRLAGVSYSVTAYAFEIYRRRTNLAEKLTGAAVAFGTCEPVVDDLRVIAPRANLALHQMGIDAAKFRRTRPQPGGRHVLAIGRLVEKKGFAHLLTAAARLRDAGHPLDRVIIVGDGPLRGELENQISALRLGDTVTLAGKRDPGEIPALLEACDVVAMPCVIAADGDRDALPTVVLEALAMEVPVVASDLMGLPEVLGGPWGRLVPPGDAPALADALADLLDRPAADRAALGARARAFVAEERDGEAWAGRLIDAIGEVA